VLVHGLGGSSGSSYLTGPARHCRQLGISSLRIDLRGADPLGEDLYHAGLSGDLHHVLMDPRLDQYERRYLWGFSLGGHVCLRYAADQPRGAAHAVAAITTPLDLDAGATLFDHHMNPLYRRYVLNGLLAMYRAFVARRGPWPLSLQAARRLRRIRDFDDAIVAPRFGFADASDYYAGRAYRAP
jgi:predicted alpha/beta-fold hydrolase